MFKYFVEVGRCGKNKPNTLLKQAKIQVVSHQLYKYESVYRIFYGVWLLTHPKAFRNIYFHYTQSFWKVPSSCTLSTSILNFICEQGFIWKLQKKKILNLSFCFSGPRFTVFGLNLETLSVNLSISQSKCRKMRTRKNSKFKHFSCSAPATDDYSFF